MINVKKTRLSHKCCPYCKKDCNIKTYKDHKRLHFDSDMKSWYVSSASDGAAFESDIEGLSSSLSSSVIEGLSSSLSSSVIEGLSSSLSSSVIEGLSSSLSSSVIEGLSSSLSSSVIEGLSSSLSSSVIEGLSSSLSSSDIEGLSSSLSSEKEDYSGAEDNISQPMFEEAEEYAADNDSEPAGKSSFIILQNLRSFTIISLPFYRLSHRILV